MLMARWATRTSEVSEPGTFPEGICRYSSSEYIELQERYNYKNEIPCSTRVPLVEQEIFAFTIVKI